MENNLKRSENNEDQAGKTTGKNVDESMVGLTDSGTSSNIYVTVDGATTTGQVAEEPKAVEPTDYETRSGAVIKSGDIGSSNAGKDPSSEGGKYVEVPKKDGQRRGGTGTGAAMNDTGERLDDIDSGTGSAQRGNQAGVDSLDTGIITEE